jgi:dynein heavy chain
MAMQERHRWMAANVAAAFDMIEQTNLVEEMFTEYNNFKKINDFLEGKSKHKHVFIYHQKPDMVNNETGELMDAKGDAKLIITTGEHEDMRIKSHAVYFLRTVADQKAVKLEVACDHELLFGEVSAAPLESLSTGLNDVFRPLLCALATPIDWSVCDGEQTHEFKSGFEKFTTELADGIRTLADDIVLELPVNREGVDWKATQPKDLLNNTEVIEYCDGLLENWCNVIEKYLESGTEAKKESGDPGPRTELDSWRNRLQKITSLTEQLKLKERQKVFQVLKEVSDLNPETAPKSRSTASNTLRRWKLKTNIAITEALNEAKDNVKYLTTLSKFVEPLYHATPSAIIDALPALMNAVKMIYTIARYYNTPDRMTNLFSKITNQMITICKQCIQDADDNDLWDKDPPALIKNLGSCIELNEAYQEQYRATKETLLALPKGKQFDFSETLIFGRFDLFCRRVHKLQDMFQTIHQFTSLSQHRFDGMEPLVNDFKKILEEFRIKRHDLLDFDNNRFDRDYVEFNVRISDLESNLRQFINQSFESIQSIEASLTLLKKFQGILRRENLRQDLESKFAVIFHNYGLELTQVQDQYEKFKAQPPLVRNLPPVAGHITWSRHLYKRIEGPMRKFQCNPSVLAGKDSKKLIRMYNKMAKTLIEFETLWHQAWVNSVEAAKSGLAATLIIKHPDDGMRFHVNFDWDILQLIRETKCINRMGSIEIPAAANMVLLQEQKFKTYNSELTYLLKEYRRVVQSIKPIAVNLLKPHIENLEFKMRPGMVTLTWTSMNIETYIEEVWSELDKLEQMVMTVNDYMENRIDANLKVVSSVLLVNLPDDQELVTLDEFVEMQERHVRATTDFLVGKSVEIESAVNDMLGIIVSFELTPHVNAISESEIIKVKAHYNWSMYQALLNATKRSLNTMKMRLALRPGDGGKSPPAFFEVELQLDGLGVRLMPSVSDIQAAINGGAVAVLKCSKMIEAWDTVTIPKNVQLILNPNLPPVQGTGSQGTFYDRIAQDREILKVVLLLTGSIQSTKNQCDLYLSNFSEYEWLWHNDINADYKSFKDTEPSYDEFAGKLRTFVGTDSALDALPRQHQISALSLQTDSLVKSLKGFAQKWKEAFATELHKDAYIKLEGVSEEIKKLTKQLAREVDTTDIDALGYVMQSLQEVRAKQSEIELDFIPISTMYKILEENLPDLLQQDKEEQDMRAALQRNWSNLVKTHEERQEEFSLRQVSYKKNLIKTVNSFKKDVNEFRSLYDRHGPMVKGIPPREAVERLKRFKEEYDVRARKQDIYYLGEDLFGLPHQQYPKLDLTKQELGYLSQLYDLYVAVLETIKEWKDYLWTDVPEHMETMQKQIDTFAGKCKKMPKQLRDWPAYHELKKEIEDFQEVLPLLQELGKESIMPRHWQQVMDISGKELPIESDNFKLQSLLDAKLNEFTDEISDICEGADKQLKIENSLKQISDFWEIQFFDFGGWKQRDYPCVLVGAKVGETQEALEETMMNLNTMNAQRHSLPFKEELTALLTTLSDTADTTEKWFKVQQMWTSLESVFTGGDIAKQMPMEAKRFQQIDKDWIKIMQKSAEQKLVVPCCSNDMLKQLLPVLSGELERCQKSLESYLEGKRNKFPRFYFTSDPVLLKILSQGSDPESIQEDFEKLFDAITRVQFDKADKKKIMQIQGVSGTAVEAVNLQVPTMAVGNIEDWLLALEFEMQRSIRRECRIASMETSSLMLGLTVADFGKKSIAQVCLLGIQLMWTVDFEDALSRMKSDKKIMAEMHKKFVQMLSDLVGVCLTDLGSKMNRTKFETLVTIHVHQKDLFQEVWKKAKEHKVKDENDFEWLKQTRMYWRTETDHAVIQVADVDFVYSYEYLGVKERLVITALTDRCYLTLSQALGMFQGGAPAGPAGTGKTETTKDMGRTLGIYVVVTNCSDQHRFRDMAKIFKGLCMSGLWGCFDEFNRIELEVLSVVAMQVETINAAKKANAKNFMFPGEIAPIKLVTATGYFITMNPGYAGRQALPENLKVLFRGVTMMVPNRETIMKVKLASVGYASIDILGKKFCILYALCEQQLSKQRHYDFGLRNILSVLRTSGTVKRSEPPDADEEMLFMRTVRDMNLSKLVADDVPLFLALLKDLFPKVTDPPNVVYEAIEKGSKIIISREKLIQWDSWFLKVIQLYETSLVRHGFMLVGPTLSGKTEIELVLTQCMTEDGHPHKIARLNPKAITNSQMYGVKDPISEEWTPGVFASIWQRFNNRNLKYTTWIICDGPVDAIWIENLNTVLDDNKILTLANNDRIPMTDNCKIVFEVQDLRNASPATVSRAGIIFVSGSDLGWEPLAQTWLKRRVDIAANRQAEADIVGSYIDKWLKTIPPNAGAAQEFFDWNSRSIVRVMPVNNSIIIQTILNLMSASILPCLHDSSILEEGAYRRLLAWCIMWGFGGLLEPEERSKCWNKFAEILQAQGGKDAIPPCKEDQTIFEYVPDWHDKARNWKVWAPEEWKPPKKLNFSALLIPTMDSVRAEYLIDITSQMEITRTPCCFKSSLMVGAPGTAKTSTAIMYMAKFSLDQMVSKNINFSSATSPLGFQKNVEGEIERKTGKTFCPPGGKKMTVFIDDASMPLVNTWGDQITNELTRQLIEQGGFYFLDKDKRGDFKSVESLQYIAAMGIPGGGKNDIPDRMKSKFLCFNMVLPSAISVDAIYGAIIRAKFTPKAGAKPGVMELCKKLTVATISVWDQVKSKLLPTPSRFHYLFNMRELSRVFQGIFECPVDCVKEERILVALWKHECQRVFADKLSRAVDKEFVDKTLSKVMPEYFGEELADLNKELTWFCDFQREVEFDEETGEEIGQPKIYEPAQSWDFVKGKAYEALQKFNETFPAKSMNLVLFDEAMSHMMKVNRTIQQKRGSMMLVGVGGSGKQSLSRLAAYTSQHRSFQITITKTYNDNAFFEDVRALCIGAGQKGESITFIFTDAEVKSESFLEYINSMLATGEIPGLFAKDEKDGMCGEVRNDFVKDNPTMEENLLNLYNYLLTRLRDNLHIALCFSPVNAKFPIRAQKFPAVFSVNINWFLPWPEAALVAVSTNFLSQFDIDASQTDKNRMYGLLGSMQAIVGAECDVYYQRMRKHVYVTPKSYLCLIDFYKALYKVKYDDINKMEQSVNGGLLKLKEASEQVGGMKIQLAEQGIVLKQEEEKTNALLKKVTMEKGKADKKKEEVGAQAAACQGEADKINAEKAEAQKELDNAMPFLHDAESACNSITKKDIGDLKANTKPVDIIKLTFDGLQIVMSKPVVPVQITVKLINKVEVPFIADSFDEFSRSELCNINFLSNLMNFAENEKDTLNQEICELLEPYLRFNEDPAKHWGPWSHKVLEPSLAEKASGAAAGLCKFVGAMVGYYGASKIVKPKMDQLKVAEARLAKAMGELHGAEEQLNKVLAIVKELDDQLQDAQNTMAALQASANAMQRQMDAANKLLSGLAGENTRWTNDSKNFATRRKMLVGDIACVCAFVTYVGPFNTEFRHALLDMFVEDTHKRKVPAHEKIVPESFLVTAATIGEWGLEGLPSDDLSIQNAIMVTRSSRYPLMVDPQSQANRWIKRREQARIEQAPNMCMTTLNNKQLKDQIEFTMSEGLCLLIENVENEVDPMLDPVMDKAIIKKGKNLYINVSDQNMDFSPKFSLYMTSRLPNPHFSPELSAKCTVIDFTVTLIGLEQQLLGRLISMEQKSLEESLSALQEDVQANTKSLQDLSDQLLERLATSQGNLLDDEDIIQVLTNTKAKAKEVEIKLQEADERTIEINEKREQFRPVATRGSIMYFNMVDMCAVVNPITGQKSGWMYNCSLMQFLEQFDISVRNSEKAQPTAKRVDKIIAFLTYQVYRYTNRGLFERDKMMFKLLVTLKIKVIAKTLTGADVSMFLKAGSALDSKAEKQNPFKWMPEKAWLNTIQLSRHAFSADSNLFFREILEFMQRNEAAWRKWYDENEPEACPVPDYEERITMERSIGQFLRMVLVRSLREDRTGISCDMFIESALDSRFSAPVTDQIADIYEETTMRVPVLYLLSLGSDPTLMIDELAKKKKKFPTDKVSMGEGQDKVARQKMQDAFITGGWVILNNAHLGIGYMNELEDMLGKTPEIDADFRLWLSCEITETFPIGLLQMAIKVTLEPPAGLKAGLARTYSTMVSQELLDKIDHERWRTLVYAMCFLHSIVQERRKFGPIGWCVPYEYNNSDLDACLLFLEKHVAATVIVGQPVSWTTVQYMVSEVQYGGRITDDLDRELFNTYAAKWMCEDMFKNNFAFNNYTADYNYKIPEGLEIQNFRDAIDTLPSVDSPLIFGLHPNADLTYRLKDNQEMITTIIETQPKDAGSGAGKSVDEIVKDLCEDLLSKMPPDFVEEVFRAQIQKLKGPTDKGFAAPLNIFLFQELQRLQNIIKIVRTNLKSVSMAIDGTVVMTQELLNDLNAIFDTRVPTCWYLDASGAEISWLMPNIGGWFTGLIDRSSMLNTWLENGRQKSYWLTGFTNAQGFLTGMRQEVTRQHVKVDKWALDDVISHTEVLSIDVDRVRDVPEEGQNIHGLFIEGGRWQRAESKLDESEPKKLFTAMPVIFCTAATAKELRGAVQYGPFGPYNAAVYKYPKRNDRYLIFRMLMKTDMHPFHWKLRGVCLVAQTD